ncbi:hypothetical protein KKB43_06615 [Patescibacteria group bacterium]|nr:hypothetical protein [Patescibacteria group bacterium]MBU4580652.1 hypothetical protein [Patescibacteria group bacterium]
MNPITNPKNKKIIKILLIFILLSVSFLAWINGLYPVSSYTPPSIEAESMNACDKIQSNEFRELCFQELKNKNIDIEKYSSLLDKYNIIIGRCGGFGSPAYCLSREDINIFLKNKNDSTVCKNLSAGSDSDISRMPKSYCLALTKNPYFCGRIPLDVAEFSNTDLQRRECYLDMAIIWKDSALCEKLRDKEKDVCYLTFSSAKNNIK